MTNEEVKEELEKVLAWLQSEDDPGVLEKLGGFRVAMSDFERALENVQPSAKREGFATSMKGCDDLDTAQFAANGRYDFYGNCPSKITENYGEGTS
ncbi:unnamed protein product [Cylicostephanus goldi]|uniref:Uncharacterized protein n=1 Tax=Cylicostephanus goldi TaxID=71465 RepID=A0A3P6SVL0_CYLGO|nr:unnamed protein product [Cylicostephanus goldi]